MSELLSNQTLIHRGSHVLMNTYARYPIAFVKGEGCWVWDADGKRYLDLLSGVAVNALGHAHPRLSQAISGQAAKLIHVSNLYYNQPQIELAELLTRHSFADRVFFCNSGAEANEGAVKLARKYFYKKGISRIKIITMENSFHGRTLGMISATGQAKVKKGFDPLLEGFVHVPYGNLQALENAISQDVGAVLLEPVQGEGGVVFASEDYLRGVYALCKKHGLLLIYDEVQTGVGRTGKMFAYEHSGIEPDIMTLAKGLAGGVPIGAVLATEEIASAFEPGDHAATFGGNPLSTRAALEVIHILQESVLENCQKMGGYFLEKLQALQKKYPILHEVRGKGLMIGVELTIPGKEIVQRAMQKGLLINCTQEKVIRLVPPLIISSIEIDQAIQILDKVFQEIAS